jgi:hypothetical protein
MTAINKLCGRHFRSKSIETYNGLVEPFGLVVEVRVVFALCVEPHAFMQGTQEDGGRRFLELALVCLHLVLVFVDVVHGDWLLFLQAIALVVLRTLT